MGRFMMKGSRWKIGIATVGMIAGLVVAWGVGAQTTTSSGASRAWDGSWTAGLGGEEPIRETVSGEVVVVVAYMALWVILLLYVVRLSFGLKALERDVRALQRRLDEGGRSS